MDLIKNLVLRDINQIVGMLSTSPIIPNEQHQLAKAHYLSVLIVKKQLEQSLSCSLWVITSESADGFALCLSVYERISPPTTTALDPASRFEILVRVCLQRGLRRKMQNLAEAGLSVAQLFLDQLPGEGSTNTLQLYSWHAVEAIKQRLITEVLHKSTTEARR